MLSNPEKYRIKPELKYRPFKNAEECWKEMMRHQPFGWIKPIQKDVIRPTIMYYITKVAPSYIKYDDVGDYCEILEFDKRFEDVFKTMTFTDGSPFGILEENLDYSKKIE